MKTRLLTGIGIISVLILFFFLREVNIYIFDAFIGIIIICSALEISRVFIRSRQYNNMTLISLFPMFYYLIFIFTTINKLSFGIFILLVLAILALFVVITILWTILDKKSTEIEIGNKSLKQYRINKILLTTFMFIYPTLLLGIMFIFNHSVELDWFNASISANVGLISLLLMFVVSMCTDTFAYLFGSILKGPKLCPLISPKKTISGAIGGLIGGLFGSVILYLILTTNGGINGYFLSANIHVWQFIFIGIFGSMSTQCGDIFASWLKRKALTKDFSSIFPGHGGFMDRFDGISFNALIVLISSLIIFA